MLGHEATDIPAPATGAIQELVTTVGEYSAAFLHEQPVAVGHLCGRMIRGRRSEDFTTLTDDSERRLVMLMGPDGLSLLPGRSGYDMLSVIGYTPEHIAHKVNQGMSFKLAVFAEGPIARLATWDNVTDLASQTYPEVSDTLRRHRSDLKTARFADIEAAAGYSFGEIDRLGKSDERYMSYERFLTSARDLPATRAFYYYALHLREQYSGDGYTYDSSGRRGMLEYIIPNRPIAELGTHALLDVRVDLPLHH